MDENLIAIQDTYSERFQYCWGCGSKNEKGIHIKSYPTKDSKICYTKITPDEKFTGGIPKNLFGGFIAMIFDCHGTASAAFFNHYNKGLKLNKDTIIERFITARLEIDYKKPTPMNEEIEVLSKLEELSEKKAIVSMKLIAKNEVRALAKIVAVKVKDDM